MSKLKVTKIEEIEKGKIYYIAVESRTLRILVTKHAEERLNRWSIDTKKLFETLLYPDGVLTGHRGRYIVHKRYGAHIVRVIYEYENNLPVIVTVYYPSAKRYFRGGGTYADRILP